MSPVRVEAREGVAVVTLDHGVTNAISAELVRELGSVVRDLGADPDVRGLVLTGAGGKFFSIGFDIPRLLPCSREEFGDFYRGMNRVSLALLSLPRPTAAALTGHAIAGGCILALCCDYRVIAEGRKLMGLNEIKLGVPIPYPGAVMLRDLVGARVARDVVESGRFFEPDDLLAMGLVDLVAPAAEVLDHAVEKVRGLGEMPPAAYAALKADRVERVLARVEPQLGEKEDRFLDCWFSDDARARLEEAMKKF